MFGEEIRQLSNSAADKYRRSREGFLSYMMSAAVAGFFIFVATILSNIASAMLMDVSPAAAKLAGAFLFSIAIILIVFIGGELFTGNNMTMAVGVYTG
ncbi:MAG: formate/nitrite transporter family protein, partial [Lachnospiraceae bacterium]|nr:formate/nitrite transporter family protein [Lachnospiraceae bacterium]